MPKLKIKDCEERCCPPEGCGCCFSVLIAMDDDTGASGTLTVTSTALPSLNVSGVTAVSRTVGPGSAGLIDFCSQVAGGSGSYFIRVTWQSCGQSTPYCDLQDADGASHTMPDFSDFITNVADPSEQCFEVGCVEPTP